MFVFIVIIPANFILTTLEHLLKTTRTREVWLYFICRTTQPGRAGTTTNLQIVLNTQKNPYLNKATQKNTCKIFLPKKIPESKISDPKKSFDHPRHLKSTVTPLGLCVVFCDAVKLPLQIFEPKPSPSLLLSLLWIAILSFSLTSTIYLVDLLTDMLPSCRDSCLSSSHFLGNSAPSRFPLTSWREKSLVWTVVQFWRESSR